MEFCSVCDNMLYLKLKTDDVDKTNYRQKAYIEKYCKSCGYKTSKVTDSCFYKNTYNLSMSSSTHQEKINLSFKIERYQGLINFNVLILNVFQILKVLKMILDIFLLML